MSRLKTLREKNNLSRKELAELSGVKKATIVNYELGYHNINNARCDILHPLARVLKCKIVDLLELGGKI